MAVVVALLALAVRVALRSRSLGGDMVPLGPDAADWVRAVRGFLEGAPEAVLPHRYPLVPKAAALLVQVTGCSPSGALSVLAMGSGSTLAGLSVLLAARFLRPTAALLLGLWVAINPAPVDLSLSTSACSTCAVAFVLLAGCLMGAMGPGRPPSSWPCWAVRWRRLRSSRA